MIPINSIGVLLWESLKETIETTDLLISKGVTKSESHKNSFSKELILMLIWILYGYFPRLSNDIEAIRKFKRKNTRKSMETVLSANLYPL